VEVEVILRQSEYEEFIVFLQRKVNLQNMDEITGRYINPYTDYGFKLLFGTEPRLRTSPN
jgi:hypothetical protein